MAHSEHSSAPGLPEIQDEAADTPMWVPVLGLGLLVLGAVGIIVSAAMDESVEAPTAEIAVE